MIQKDKNSKHDAFDQLVKIANAVKLAFFDPLREIYLGLRSGALPSSACWMVGIVLSMALFTHMDSRMLSYFGRRSIPSGVFRDVLGITSVFWGFLAWGYYRLAARSKIRGKLERAFLNAGLQTRLKETPEFLWDWPLDEFTRKLRLRGRGIPISSYVGAKEHLETQLNVSITKLENPGGNREVVDVVYTTERMPDFWVLDSLIAYKDFSFPIGRGYRGEIKASLKTIPHYLVAGESGGGKSSFIRMMVTVLLANNQDLEVYFIDFKGGMENQVFEGFDNIHLIDNVQDAAMKMGEVNRILDTRMREFKNAKARTIEMYNQRPGRSGEKEKRILVVVDEIAELMPTVGGKYKSALGEVNSVLNRVSRMGRAVGIGVVVGVQKPDTRNLDPTIKMNLVGIVCFPVNHFTQSTIVLGNGRAAELNPEYKGRAIWKYGVEQMEVQAPLLTETEVANARAKIERLWGKRVPKADKEVQPDLELPQKTKTHTSGSGAAEGGLEMESPELSDGKGAGVQDEHVLDSLPLDQTDAS